MSLIEEALRRVQDPLRAFEQKTSPSSSAPPATTPTQSPSVHSWPTTSPIATPSPTPSTHPSNVVVFVALAVLFFTAVLIVGGAVWMTRTFGEKSSAGMGSPPVSAPTSGAPSASPSMLDRREPTQGQRNQMLSTESPTPTNRHNNTFMLSGVVEGVGEPYAVINGTIVGVGDTISGATLLEIDKGSVTLRDPNGNTTVLRVPR